MRTALLIALGCCASLAGPATAGAGPPDRAPPGDDAVVYGVIPGELGTHGADSVTARLDDLVDLGVNVLWLSPITKTLPGDFGYAITDYFALRKDFGDARSFHRLIDEAHRRGLKVLMDLAVNHTSDRHPYFLDAQRRGRASPYWSYYDRDPQQAPTHYFDWTHLPNLDYDNPRVRKMVADAFGYWVQQFDVDGFRLDAAWGVRDRYPAFWPSLIASLRQRKPGLMMIAEASARDPYYAKAGFDCAYDWAGPLGHWAWQDAFDDPAQIAPRLRAILAHDSGGCALRFLNNNDTGARFITRHGPELTRVAACLLFTLPGVPLVYTGDEVGAEFLPYGPAHAPIRWTDRHGLRPLYKRLIALRHRVPALRSRSLALVSTDADDRVLAYVRSAKQPGGGESVALVMLDFGAAADTRLALPRGLPAGAWVDLASGERVAVATGRVKMPKFGVRVLVPEGLAPGDAVPKTH
jgi:glycosidase